MNINMLNAVGSAHIAAVELVCSLPHEACLTLNKQNNKVTKQRIKDVRG